MSVAMSLPELEKIDTSIVVLAGVEKDMGLNGEEVAAIIRDPQVTAVGPGAGQPLTQVQITSLRDQVIVTIQGAKFQFEDKSDEMPGTNRLPDIVHKFLALFQRQGVDRFRAYGINFTIAFDARGEQAASEVIADRYVNRDALSQRGQISVRGAALHLYFNHVDALCTMKLEPRLGKVDAPRFFANINYHFELADEQMPPLGELTTKYRGLWPQFTDLLDSLLVRP